MKKRLIGIVEILSLFGFFTLIGFIYVQIKKQIKKRISEGDIAMKQQLLE
jgi:hypothetical protein